eukprot:2856033-Pyramimonas_sp.AAC.1
MGLWGDECTPAVIGAGGPVKRKRIDIPGAGTNRDREERTYPEREPIVTGRREYTVKRSDVISDANTNAVRRRCREVGVRRSARLRGCQSEGSEGEYA